MILVRRAGRSSAGGFPTSRSGCRHSARRTTPPPAKNEPAWTGARFSCRAGRAALSFPRPTRGGGFCPGAGAMALPPGQRHSAGVFQSSATADHPFPRSCSSARLLPAAKPPGFLRRVAVSGFPARAASIPSAEETISGGVILGRGGDPSFARLMKRPPGSLFRCGVRYPLACGVLWFSRRRRPTIRTRADR